VKDCSGGGTSTWWQGLLGVSWWGGFVARKSPSCWNGLSAN